jgi:hypothetical protein
MMCFKFFFFFSLPCAGRFAGRASSWNVRHWMKWVTGVVVHGVAIEGWRELHARECSRTGARPLPYSHLGEDRGAKLNTDQVRMFLCRICILFP